MERPVRYLQFFDGLFRQSPMLRFQQQVLETNSQNFRAHDKIVRRTPKAFQTSVWYLGKNYAKCLF